MKNKKTILFIGMMLAVFFGGVGVYYISRLKRSGIYLYRAEHDLPFVEELFEKNWYWLIPEGAAFDVKDTFTRLMPPPYEFQAKSKALAYVYWVNNEPAGLIVYYMKNFYHGKIWFVVVREEMRGRGISEKLLSHAMQDLKFRGASSVSLITRTNNVRAQGLYKKADFKEKQYHDDRFVTFEKRL